MRSSILFVDHDIRLTDAVCRSLSVKGHNVMACTDGLQCVTALHDSAPTVLVLDREVLWGGGDGVLEYLIRDEALMPPMVVVTVNPGGQQLPDHLEPWVDMQLERPTSLNDLLPFLNQLETLAWWSNSPYRTLSPSAPQKVPSSPSNMVPSVRLMAYKEGPQC